MEYGISFFVYALIMGAINIKTYGTPNGMGVYWIVFIPLLFFYLAQGAKRCHDIGKSGYYQLIPFYFLWLIFTDSQFGENEYGENPKGIADPLKGFGIQPDPAEMKQTQTDLSQFKL